MKNSTLDHPASSVNDCPELQDVLTRFVDSRDGYLQAAETIGDPGLQSAFRSIAGQRQQVAGTLTELIHVQGADAERDGSNEAAVHRWWLKLRAGASADENRAVLAECLRGEKELKNTLLSAMIDPEVPTDHLQILQSALDQIIDTVAELEAAVGEI